MKKKKQESVAVPDVLAQGCREHRGRLAAGAGKSAGPGRLLLGSSCVALKERQWHLRSPMFVYCLHEDPWIESNLS